MIDLPPSAGNQAASALTADAARHMGLGFCVVMAAAWLLTATGGFGWRLWAGAGLAYGPIAVIAIAQVRRHHPYRAFGAANLVTTVRAAMTCLLAGLLADVASVPPGALAAFAWGVAGLSALSLALDGLDGLLARRLGLCSAFGARYDMEVDALLILLMSLAAWSFDKAGAWVILSGALRYLFVAASWVWPVLGEALPPSNRRKLICVVQAGALCLLMSPLIQPPVSVGLAAAALALLVYSFAIDVAWLTRRDRAARVCS
jgi:phosphatidylglycerophosphate synthase